MKKSQPVLSLYKIGEQIDFMALPKGRMCNLLGDKVGVCPHCKRNGMRKTLLSGKVRFIHMGRKGETQVEPQDACTMWLRTEFKLQFGADTLHPKFRQPGDEDMTVEEIRPEAKDEEWSDLDDCFVNPQEIERPPDNELYIDSQPEWEFGAFGNEF